MINGSPESRIQVRVKTEAENPLFLPEAPGQTLPMTDMRPTVLVVEDDEINFLIIEKILGSDYVVEGARDGFEALDRMASEPRPDVVLLDVLMPGLDGYEVCRRLKEHPETRDIPVLFVTACTTEQEEEKGLGLGAVDYITKPFQPAIIRARLQTQLRLKQARETLAERNRELENLLLLRESMEQIARHDIKSPLNAVLAVNQILLMDDHLASDQREYLKMQRRAGHKMLEMINRSLDMFKMERGEYRLHPVEVDLLEIARQVIEEVGHPRVRLLVNGRAPAVGEEWLAWGEDLLFYSMLSNLVKNAAEASTPSDVLEIAFRRHAAGILIQIHNPAVVPEAVRATFFDKYVTQGKSSGTGLGTYSAKLIATTLGGQIRMATSLAEGTTIRICLPGQGFCT